MKEIITIKRRERDTLLRRVMEPYPLRISGGRLAVLYGMTQADTTAEPTYFFHPDHLGSASWITDLSGQLVHLFFRISKSGSLEYQHFQCETKTLRNPTKSIIFAAETKGRSYESHSK